MELSQAHACWQINLQQGFGGGEIYTAFLARAMTARGIAVQLIVSGRSSFWRSVDCGDAQIIPVADERAALAALPEARSWVLTHGGLGAAASATLRAQHFLSAMVHMPLYGRSPDTYRDYALVIPVSQYVRRSLVDAGYAGAVYAEPLLGVAEVRGAPTERLLQSSRYDWDRRKLRDRSMALVEPLLQRLRPHRVYVKRPGITLGIISRLTPIKQWPELLSRLTPHLLAFPQIQLEIIGNGGYRSVADLAAAVKPLGNRVRWWGFQRNVAAAFSGVDYVLSGLPEKEALGLNLIEAQAAGVPVLAVAAAPFDETVLGGQTGYLYTDPRTDGGQGFAATLLQVVHQPAPAPLLASQHLQQFSFEAFADRVARLAQCCQGR